MCPDNGIADNKVRATLRECGFTAHRCSRSEEGWEITCEAGKWARRWVVERSHHRLNRFRYLLIRWEKKLKQHLAFLHFAYGLIALRAAVIIFT